MDEITVLAAHIHAATARFLELVAELDRRGWCGSEGWRSTAQWLSHHCAIGPGAAREHVRVARALDELPLVRAAFARGELSYSKVRAVTRVEDVRDEAGLLGLAVAASASQLERLVRTWRGIVQRDRSAEQVHAERFVSWYHDDDGAVVFRGRLAPEEGAVVIAAIEAARAQIDPAERPAPVRRRELGNVPAGTSEAEGVPAGTSVDRTRIQRLPVGAQRADALVTLADSILSEGLKDRSGGDRHQVVVHVDADTLSDPSTGCGCELEHGEGLPGETARRLSCDSSLVRIIERDGRPLSVGRKTRTIPAAIRRALRSRDHGCRFPGCNQNHGVDAHHIQHWAAGGETKLTNLVQLCRYHHRLVHEGGFTVERSRGNALAFRRPDGKRVTQIPRLPRGNHAYITEQHSRAGIRIDPDTCRPPEYFPMDLHLTIQAMNQITSTEAPGI